MKTLMTRKAALSAAALAVLGSLLAGCSGGPEAAQPSPSASTAKVASEDLGKALDRLVFQGTGAKSTDGGACLVRAVQDKKLSDTGQAYIVGKGSDDIAAVANGLREVSVMDAAILLSPELRDKFDACVDAVILPTPTPGATAGTDGKDQVYAPPKQGQELPQARQPDLTPKFPVPQGTSINSSSQLTAGLVSMFSSYALNEDQKKTYEASGECLAGVVFQAGFSQETLRFLAGGASIGAGSISDFLPKEEDKTIWKSRDFTAALVDCTASATPKNGKA
ncbi:MULTISPECIES: hypothetical protein [Paenarthrobacter]|uniref:Lipoprotein n=1 Tax=Paenarthrobacter ureafaciens TaxID=37931 RepID=A0AAX3EDA8_PAEUR|nr:MULTISPECIES: hypothetical protein [Paenarthrobacter]NKR13247.1 hypothetical protein [Arthrobacter sp. M5]NKR14903.1 hypothetical protein [Arthrobacter sp. M6]OEH62455.1 hypothetical protein A5N13_02005 [Arthrobacter sp. D4]OEH63026.1 hypothetical protein A5N17_10245 [Arthrobacter sp. D2]MDO5865206.1 hypothetical protein [Paenarthrobacter sp. SD-2]